MGDIKCGGRIIVRWDGHWWQKGLLLAFIEQKMHCHFHCGVHVLSCGEYRNRPHGMFMDEDYA